MSVDEAATLRDALVDELKKNKVLSQERVEAALRTIPRHLFLPELPLEEVYADKAIPTKMQDGVAISSSSQPAIMAIMLEQLGLERGQRVLEIGAGTGYNAALMGFLVGPEGHVTAVDIDEDIVARAREHIAAAGLNNIDVVCADGGFGYAPHAPYDAVVATVGIWDIPPSWVEQLREGGRLVAPMWFNTLQFSIAFEKKRGLLVSHNLSPCGFMRLRGAFAGPEAYVQVDGVTIGSEDSTRIDAEAVARLLDTSPVVPRNLSAAPHRGLISYLGLLGEPLLTLFAHEKEKYGFEYAVGVLDQSDSLTLFVPAKDDCGDLIWALRVYGTGSSFAHVSRMMETWNARGRPDLARAHITAAPIGTLPPNPNCLVVRKRWMEYEIDF